MPTATRPPSSSHLVPLAAAASSPLPIGERPATLPSLTGLRWMAAMFVFGFHLVIVSYFSGAGRIVMAVIFGGGDTGVSLFFILSGFVLAWSHDPHMGPGRFWRRRFARIWPLHVTAVALALVVAALWVPGIRTPGAAPLVANVVLVSDWHSAWWQAGNPVSWSLVCEAFFYLLFPFLVRALRPLSPRWLAVVACAMVVATIEVPAVASSLPGHPSSYSSPILRLPEFVVGVAIALLMRSGAWRGARMRLAVPAVVIGYLLAMALAFTPYGASSCTVVGFALLISALARRDVEKRPTLMAQKVMVRLGELSFAFYLVHLLVMASVSSPWPQGHPQLPAVQATSLALAAFLIALAMAWLLHRFVEVPCQALLASGTRGRGKKYAARRP